MSFEEISFTKTKSIQDFTQECIQESGVSDECNDYKYIFSRDPSPIHTTGKVGRIQEDLSYKGKVDTIMSYGNLSDRVTVVYIVTSKVRYLQSMKQFQTSFNVMSGNINIIVCTTGGVSVEYIQQNPFHTNSNSNSNSNSTTTTTTITYIESNSYSQACSVVFEKEYIKTPYTFLFQDTYLFDDLKILHPLCYLIDVLEQTRGTLNSIRFTSTLCNSNKPSTVDTFCGVDMYNTNTFTDEPFLIRTKVASMFIQPYIDPNGIRSLGFITPLSNRYKNLSILEKLKMMVYGSPGYPPCCKTQT
jgi:hypothetical protein